MFTGLIEEIGIIESAQLTQSGKITIHASKILEGIRLGDSIAVNGVCLTVVAFTYRTIQLDVMAETMRRSNLGKLKKGDKVNLERAMAADGRFGGHIVTGHVDGTGILQKKTKEQNAVWIQIECGEAVQRYLVEKGSITIDGISLTVAKLIPHGFQVSIIPHTGRETTLLTKQEGEQVNLENDILAKYIEKLMEPKKEKQKEINLEFLQKCGF